MVKEIFEIEDLSEFNPNDNDLENELINYLKDNRIDASGFHVQAGLRFKILVLDSHLNFRYTIAENVYDGSNGFAQAMFKIGMAF